jgi:nitrite reductase/ring-hydroxylating ferredoxin subunit
MRLLIKSLLFSVLFLLMLSPEACKKTTVCNGIPNVAVTATVDVSLPSNSALATVGGYELVTGGNDGIVVYRSTTSTFTAFDALCPHEGTANYKAQVQPQSGGIYAKCPVCGSVFLLSDGSVNKGPSTCPLKAYTTYFSGSTVNITN